MASQFLPFTVVDDSGTPSAPVGNGTQLNNALFQALMANLNELLTRSAVTWGGTISSERLGTHAFSASGAGQNQILVRNAASGSANLAGVTVQADGAGVATLQYLSSTFSPGGLLIPDLTRLVSTGAGGLLIDAAGAAELKLAANSNVRIKLPSAANDGFVINPGTLTGTAVYSNAGTPGAYNGLFIGSNLNLAATGVGGTRGTQANAAQPSWAIDLGGVWGGDGSPFTSDHFGIYRRPAGGSWDLPFLSIDQNGQTNFAPAAAAGSVLTITSQGPTTPNTGGYFVRNTAATIITGVVMDASNHLNIGSNSGLAQNDTNLNAGQAIRFWTNGANRAVISNAGEFVPLADTGGSIGTGSFRWGRVLVAPGSAAAPSLAFTSNTGLLYDSGNPDIRVSFEGVEMIRFVDAIALSSGPSVWANAGAWGTGGVSGSYARVGRNTSGGGAAGHVVFETKDGSPIPVWSDASGVLRIGPSGSPPTEGGTPDTSGTVVGTQTSARDAKDIIGRYVDVDDALALVLCTPLYRWRYKAGRGIQGEEFMGVITDDSPAFGMDRDETHPGGKSLNPANAIGLLVAAVQAQQRQIDELRKGA